MRRSALPLLAGGVVAALTLTACGSNQYDASKVEGILKQTQEGKVRGLPLGPATCPEDVELTEGVTFRCTLQIAGEPAPYKVTLTNVDADRVTVNAEPAKALIATQAIVDFIRSQLPSALQRNKLRCGDKQVLIVDPGAKIGCVLTVDGKENQIVLRVKDTKGNVVIER